MRSSIFAIALLVLFCCTIGGALGQAAQGYNLIASKAKLDLLNSQSVIPISNFTNVAGLADKLSSAVEGPWVCEFAGEEYVVCGYENFYAPMDDLYPGLVLFQMTAEGELVQKDIIHAPANTGLASSAVSANPQRPFAAMSFYKSLTAPGSAGQVYTPHAYTMPVYSFDGGKFSSAPTVTINLLTVDPQAWYYTVAYNGIAGMSKDGRFIILTYGVTGSSGLPAPYPPITIVSNRFAMLELAADGMSYTVRQIIESPATEMTGLSSFAQKAIMEEQPGNPGVYDVIIAVDSWSLSNPTGSTAQLAYYTFTDATSAFELKGTEWAPRYIQGVGFDSVNGRAWIICNGATAPGAASINQVPVPVYNNSAVDKNSNLRMHTIDRSAGTLTYEGGEDLNADGIQVQPSRDGKVLFITTAPALSNDLFATIDNPISPVGRRYAPTVVSSFSVNGAGVVDWEWSSAASPLTFAIATNPTDDKLVVAGQDTYEAIDGRFVGQRGLQLYNVRKSNQKRR